MPSGSSSERERRDATEPTNGEELTSGYRYQFFRASVWVAIAVLVLLSPAAFVLLGWATDPYSDAEVASEVSHRLHEVVFGALFSLALVGAVTQLFGARRNRAGLLQLVITLSILSAAVVTTVGWDFGLLLYLVPLIFILTFMDWKGSWRAGPVWWWAWALVAVAVLPFLGETAVHVSKALSEAQNHTTHWSAIASFSLVLLLLGGVVAIRVTGYRVVAMSIAGAAAIYGLASLLFPYDASSHRAGFAIGLLIWAVLWLVMLRFADRPRDGGHKPKTLVVVGVTLVTPFVLLFATFVWMEMDTPPNVPHTPDPAHPEVQAFDADRSTCLGCHLSGLEGAPVPWHPFSQECRGEPCWGGRTDCAGCHSIDPDLGGDREKIELDALNPLILEPHRRQVVAPLSIHDLERIRVLAAGE